MSRLLSAAETAALFLAALGMIWFTCRDTVFPDRRENVPVFSSAPGLVLILDSGHGGSDGGAVSCNGHAESRINYRITSAARSFAMLFGGEVTCTREEEEISYPPDCTTIRQQKKWDTLRRVETAEDVPGGVLLSIHQNFYQSPSPDGLQLLTAPVPGSEAFAGALFDQASVLLPETRLRPTVQIPEDVYLMNHVSCPAVLCECGFLSNPREEARLCTEEYQRQIAVTLAVGALSYMNNSMNRE